MNVKRVPQDLDILCQNWHDTQEELKRRLVQMNRKFYLIAAKTPNATYKVLWYRIGYRTNIKVDVLLPGALDICSVPSHSIDRAGGLPCVPLSHLLLYKLQGWVHHGESLRTIDRLKMPNDVRDIEAILRVIVGRNIKPFEEAYFDEGFISRSIFRISKFVFEHPETRPQWRDIGYKA